MGGGGGPPALLAPAPPPAARPGGGGHDGVGREERRLVDADEPPPDRGIEAPDRPTLPGAGIEEQAHRGVTGPCPAAAGELDGVGGIGERADQSRQRARPRPARLVPGMQRRSRGGERVGLGRAQRRAAVVAGGVDRPVRPRSAGQGHRR